MIKRDYVELSSCTNCTTVAETNLLFQSGLLKAKIKVINY